VVNPVRKDHGQLQNKDKVKRNLHKGPGLNRYQSTAPEASKPQIYHNYHYSLSHRLFQIFRGRLLGNQDIRTLRRSTVHKKVKG
jgi:hypothetical protein